MRRFIGLSRLPKKADVWRWALLVVIMTIIGAGTVYASANTYEVVSRHDLSFSHVVSRVTITHDTQLDEQLAASSKRSYDVGSFGIPKKIKLPEATRHYDIDIIQYTNGWLATSGDAQTFITTDARQKVFGQAIIYMRANTPTSRNVGESLVGDIVNIVTTEGWQLGYQVVQKSGDASGLAVTDSRANSEIIVVLVDEQTAVNESFRATLVKVGERI